MRILYGVVGEGMGHATRSRVILDHLIALGHRVEIVVSGRAHAFLSKVFPGVRVHEIAGLNMVYEDNAVHRRRTALDFLKKLPAFAENHALFAALDQELQPQLVISDFESFSYLYGKAHDLPIVSIDNMQIINRCRHEVTIPRTLEASYLTAKTVVKAKLPRCGAYLITTFFFPPVRKPRTQLFPPILRDAVLDANRRDGDHVLVYQTSDSFHELVPTLQQLPGRFLVYGLGRQEQLGNVELRAFSETGFVDDLASARAVITGGGYSLMGEAVFLGKPVYSIPLVGQFEQTLNALYLEKLGYGEYHQTIDGPSIARFLERAPRYKEALAAHRQDRNRAILDAVDELVARVERTGRIVERGASDPDGPPDDLDD
jgi:uncharacterized protein (TIGR00661 family)